MRINVLYSSHRKRNNHRTKRTESASDTLAFFKSVFFKLKTFCRRNSIDDANCMRTSEIRNFFVFSLFYLTMIFFSARVRARLIHSKYFVCIFNFNSESAANSCIECHSVSVLRASNRSKNSKSFGEKKKFKAKTNFQ